MDNTVVVDQMIDVVIPAYNCEDSILKAIESVLHQEGDFVKSIIVIDDGSTDRTANIVKNLHSSKVHLISTKNNGVSKARNLGITLANAEWVAFLDADDIWLANKLSNQLNFYASQKVDFICGDFNEKTNNQRLITFASICSGNYIATSTVMLKRELALKLAPIFNEEMSFAEDYLAWLKCVTIAKAGYVNDKLAIYNISPKPKYRWGQIIKNLIHLNLEYFLFIKTVKMPLISKVSNVLMLILGTSISIVSILRRFLKSLPSSI